MGSKYFSIISFIPAIQILKHFLLGINVRFCFLVFCVFPFGFIFIFCFLMFVFNSASSCWTFFTEKHGELVTVVLNLVGFLALPLLTLALL